MLAMTLALALVAQGPSPSGIWAATGGLGPPRGFVVAGTLQLSPEEAEDAAMRAARDTRRARLREVAAEAMERAAPFWMPAFFAEREAARWVGNQERRDDLEVVERHMDVGTYSYGKTYLATLRVAETEGSAPLARLPELERRLHAAGRLFLAKCGGIAVFWGLLAFLYSWFDRLSRGYMTWRLRLIALFLGLLVPPVAMLL